MAKNYIGFIIGIILFLDSVILFLTNESLNLGTSLPGFLGIITMFFNYVKIKSQGRYYFIKRTTRRRNMYILIIIVIAFFGLLEAYIFMGAKSDYSKKVSTVIVLGAGINGEQVSSTLKNRLDVAIDYLNQNKESYVVVSGGQGPGEHITEAEAMKCYLISKGIGPLRIITEEQSTSTMENFKFTKKVLEDNNMSTKEVMIITNDFHMARSRILAKRNGFIAYGITSKTPLKVRFNLYIREAFALVKSYIVDK